MWFLLLLPSLLLADVMVQDPTPIVDAPAATVAPVSVPVELRLQPSLSAPIALTLPESDLKDPQAATSTDGKHWFSVERQVTLEGYVDKTSIQKDLDIVKGATVWAAPDKKQKLTTVEDPSFARLLDADKMGHVQVKEPRVLYYTKDVASAPATTVAPVAVAAPAATTTAVAPVVSEAPATAKPASVSAPVQSHSSLRSLEGRLQKDSIFVGGKYYITDMHGNRIATISKSSSVDGLTLKRYLNKIVELMGPIQETGSGLVVTVKTVRIR